MKILLMLLMIDPTPPLTTPVLEYHQYQAPGYVLPEFAGPSPTTPCEQLFHETNRTLRQRGVFPEQSKVIHFECRNAI